MANTSGKYEDLKEWLIIIFYVVVGWVLYSIASQLPLVAKRIFIVVVPLAIAGVVVGCMVYGVKKGKYAYDRGGYEAEVEDQKLDTGWQTYAGAGIHKAGVGVGRQKTYIKKGKEKGMILAVGTGPFLGYGAVFAAGYVMGGLIWLIGSFINGC